MPETEDTPPKDVCSVRFPRFATSGKTPKNMRKGDLSGRLDLSFQCSDCESLHHGLCWLCRNFHLLAEHAPDTSFGGRLHTSLDAAEPWNSEDAVLLHLVGSDGHQAVND